MQDRMTFSAVGDYLVKRRLPGAYEGFDELKSFVAQGDMRFANLETTLHNFESFASQYCGGSWQCAAPETLDDLKQFGFNTVNWATNHTMDYSYGGLNATRRYLNRSGLVHAGSGLNLAEASAPAYLDTLKGRVALIGVASSYTAEAALAGDGTPLLPGRPGVNGLRHQAVYRVTPDMLAHLKHMAEITHINNLENIRRAEGFLGPCQEGTFSFGGHLFELGDPPGRFTRVDERDMNRIERAIYEAQLQADAIVISLHAHQFRAENKEEPDFFLEEFARRCIDLGAHAVVGHGPHLLRPIEIYKGRPIFYSLGNFVFQSENMDRCPADFFSMYGLPPDGSIHEAIKRRTAGFTRGLYANPLTWESVVPVWEMEQGRLTRLTLMPIQLGFGEPRSRIGWPRPTSNTEVLERLAALSAPYGTRLKIDNGLAYAEL